MADGTDRDYRNLLKASNFPLRQTLYILPVVTKAKERNI